MIHGVITIYFRFKIGFEDGRSTVGGVEAAKIIKRRGFYDKGPEVPKIQDIKLWPHLSLDRADFWYGGSFLVELHDERPFSIQSAAGATVMAKIINTPQKIM